MHFHQWRRREVLTLLGGAVAWPLAAGAQQAMPVVGFLHSGLPAPYAGRVAAFRQGLSEAGFVESRNLTIEYRWAEGRYERLPALASELVDRRVAVIVAGGGVHTAPAAKAATSTIPIVFASGVDPVAQGLVTSLARPGGNVTGISSMTTELGTKRFGLLSEMMPTGDVGILLNRANVAAEEDAKEVQAAGAALGREVHVFYAANAQEIDRAFDALSQRHAKTLLVQPDPFFTSRAAQIVALANRRTLAAIYTSREFVEAGGIMSYGPDQRDQYRLTGLYTARVLKGEKPADLPVIRPTKFELVINVITAKALGLELPPTLLARADEVIE
jgi:putative tryptophan/tyrosine transport system substrate-binding protein